MKMKSKLLSEKITVFHHGQVIYLIPDRKFAVVQETGVHILGKDSAILSFSDIYAKYIDVPGTGAYHVFDPTDSLSRKAENVARFLYDGKADMSEHQFYAHLQRVDALVSAAGYIEATENAVAFLYDTLQSGLLDVSELKGLGFSESVIQAIKALTRTPAQMIDEKEYLIQVTGNETALHVKMAVLLDQMNLSRIAAVKGVQKITQLDLIRSERYLCEFQYLKAIQGQNAARHSL